VVGAVVNGTVLVLLFQCLFSRFVCSAPCLAYGNDLVLIDARLDFCMSKWPHMNEFVHRLGVGSDQLSLVAALGKHIHDVCM